MSVRCCFRATLVISLGLDLLWMARILFFSCMGLDLLQTIFNV